MRFLTLFFILITISCSQNSENPMSKARLFLSEKYSDVPETDRKFEFYTTDLNLDGKPEYFVKLVSPYFCGTGGCTIFLFDSEFNVVQKFTVSDVFYVQSEIINGWKIILTRSEGHWRKLEYPYPNNPSVLPISTEIPSRDAKGLEYSKIYKF
ncbi:hypothetical protein N9L20_04215 [Flavobacteriaceae bacterium]|nr:hypothetical protein [Flavobacteriaceae bacterium]